MRFWGPGGRGVGLNVGGERQGGGKGCLVFLEIKSQKEWMTQSVSGEERSSGPGGVDSRWAQEAQEGLEEGVRERHEAGRAHCFVPG